MANDVTLEKVKEIKEKLVKALAYHENHYQTETDVIVFLVENRYQIMDILDDALTAHKEGKI